MGRPTSPRPRTAASAHHRPSNQATTSKLSINRVFPNVAAASATSGCPSRAAPRSCCRRSATSSGCQPCSAKCATASASIAATSRQPLCQCSMTSRSVACRRRALVFRPCSNSRCEATARSDRLHAGPRANRGARHRSRHQGDGVPARACRGFAHRPRINQRALEKTRACVNGDQANVSFMIAPNHLSMSSKLSPSSLAASLSDAATGCIVRVAAS
jgi:hypothetical protein